MNIRLTLSVCLAIWANAFFVAAAEPLQVWNEPVDSTRDWEQTVRPALVKKMETVMGTLPGPEKKCPLEPRIEEEVDCGTYVRRFLTYQAEPGGRVPAYLLVPKKLLLPDAQAPAPGVLCLHQTHAQGQKVVVGLGNSPNDEYGVELVQRGFVCIVPAYPLLANYSPDLKALGYKSGTMKAIWDNKRALDLLETFPFVKKGTFAAIGHSLGGHNSLFTAVFEPRLKVVVTSCGFDSFRDYMGGQIRGWTSERYMPELARYATAERPFDFPQVLAAIAPRHIFINAPLHDSNFKAWSVDEVAVAVRPIFRIYGAESNLIVRHPDAGHLFPKEKREEAYDLIERVLRP